MATLKVYGWQGSRPGAGHTRQTREIVAASSATEVARLAGRARPSQLFNLSTTGNSHEISQALSAPGVIFWHPMSEYPGTWRQAEPASPYVPSPKLPNARHARTLLDGIPKARRRAGAGLAQARSHQTVTLEDL